MKQEREKISGRNVVSMYGWYLQEVDLNGVLQEKADNNRNVVSMYGLYLQEVDLNVDVNHQHAVAHAVAQVVDVNHLHLNVVDVVVEVVVEVVDCHLDVVKKE